MKPIGANASSFNFGAFFRLRLQVRSLLLTRELLTTVAQLGKATPVCQSTTPPAAKSGLLLGERLRERLMTLLAGRFCDVLAGDSNLVQTNRNITFDIKQSNSSKEMETLATLNLSQ